MDFPVQLLHQWWIGQPVDWSNWPSQSSTKRYWLDADDPTRCDDLLRMISFEIGLLTSSSNLPSYGLPVGLPAETPPTLFVRSRDSCIFSKLCTCEGTGIGCVTPAARLSFVVAVFSMAVNARLSGRDDIVSLLDLRQRRSLSNVSLEVKERCLTEFLRTMFDAVLWSLVCLGTVERMMYVDQPADSYRCWHVPESERNHPAWSPMFPLDWRSVCWRIDWHCSPK